MEIQELYNAIRSGDEVRANLIELRRELKTEEKQRALAYLLGGDFTVFTGLLKSPDPKVRKNAALILGDMETEDVLPSLFEAYQREETLFVRADYLKAMEKLDCRPFLEALKDRQKKLLETAPAEENRKHYREELAALQALILNYERPKHHRFLEVYPAPDVILLTNRCQKKVTADQIRTGTVTELSSGLRVKDGDLGELMKIRTYQEMLFPIPKARPISGTPEKIGEELAALSIPDYLDRLHQEGGTYYYRLEVKGPMAMEKRGSFLRRIAGILDEKTGGRLCNAPGDYEIELRLLERRDGSFLPMLRLYTLPDKRFAYRKETVASSIAPVNGALTAALAREYLKEGAQVLDPFCGVGTMLIERNALVPARTMYGVDLYGEAIEKARKNTQAAGCVVHYINRDFFDFTHEYLFDEIITDMPRLSGEGRQQELERLYGNFFEKSLLHLKKEGILILYTMEPDLARRQIRRLGEYELLEEFLMNEKNQTEVMVIRRKK